MLPQPSILRASHLARQQFRATVFRNVLQRRFASTEPPKLVGPMDNAFNRERLAVKQHAAQSAGELSLSWLRGGFYYTGSLH